MTSQSRKDQLCTCYSDRHAIDCLFYDPFIDAEEIATPDERHGTLGLTTAEYLAEIGHDPDARSYVDWWKDQRSCRHDFDLFLLPTGETMRASAWSDVPWDRTLPDVGIYLDPAWYPADVFGYAIGWNDFGTPTMPDADVIRTAVHAYQHVQYGETVEVGCLGAHGRTGSFLAIMCVVATNGRMSGRKAVQYVRDNHCKLAVENVKQEAYVSRIAGQFRRNYKRGD